MGLGVADPGCSPALMRRLSALFSGGSAARGHDARTLAIGTQSRYEPPVPRCYFLGACSGSSLDQGTNNVSLFNLIEQINLPPSSGPGAVKPPPNGLIPIELHAYWMLEPHEIGESFQTRFVLHSLESGLEIPTEITQHVSQTPRFRTRALGLPHPPVVGSYALRVDWRSDETDGWLRDHLIWPLAVLEVQPRPAVTMH